MLKRLRKYGDIKNENLLDKENVLSYSSVPGRLCADWIILPRNMLELTMASFVTEFKHLEIQLEDIISATNNFDESKVIGGGGFGKVYKGEPAHSKSREKPVLCGRQCVENINGQLKVYVPIWKQSYEEDKLNEIILQDLKQQMDPSSLKTFADIAFQCLWKTREERPTMSRVLEELEIACLLDGKDQPISEVIQQLAKTPSLSDVIEQTTAMTPSVYDVIKPTLSTTIQTIVAPHNTSIAVSAVEERDDQTLYYVLLALFGLLCARAIYHSLYSLLFFIFVSAHYFEIGFGFVIWIWELDLCFGFGSWIWELDFGMMS
ncbi:kinase-like domain, phloem protein 2-like protein [Tanacetum coccineum]